jgi:hypothetical protein
MPKDKALLRVPRGKLLILEVKCGCLSPWG